MSMSASWQGKTFLDYSSFTITSHYQPLTDTSLTGLKDGQDSWIVSWQSEDFDEGILGEAAKESMASVQMVD